jgi:dephospho-CoA kinase
MIRIALVGSIGSGKTFISNLFGYPVFNADQSVSKIYSNNKKIFYKLKKRLPKFFTNPPTKKEELIRAIVENENNLKIISKIVHPEVKKRSSKIH